MTKIQIVFLFAKAENLTEEERDKVCNIVKEEYYNNFGVSLNSIEAEILSGKSDDTNNDIALLIETDESILNAGVKRGIMKKAVASRLMLVPAMKKLGFSGTIMCKDGLVKNTETKSRIPGDERTGNKSDDGLDYAKRAKMYVAETPKYNFELVVMTESTRNRIDQALDRITYEREVFEEWGLYSIMPNPVSALSFYGPPGTGKSMAAEAIADKLGKKIIRASYADIENKYVGEGPKNVSAIFLAAEQQDAVLFIDEADSLLSKRMVNVSDPSGQAMNSMRSQLLISLENFHGVVIFATNLAVNYDRAFVSRLINVKFDFPDADTREKIWRTHLLPTEGTKVKLNIPLADDVNIRTLAEKFEVCGRDIRNVVVDACVSAKRKGLDKVNQACLEKAASDCVNSNREVANAEDHTKMNVQEIKSNLTNEQKKVLAEAMNRQIQSK